MAKIMGIDPRTAKAWGERHGVLVEVNGVMRVCREKLKTAFPDAYREVTQGMYDDSLDDFKDA